MIHFSDGEEFDVLSMDKLWTLNQPDVVESDTTDSEDYFEEISLTGETERKSLKFENNDYTVPIYHPVEHTSKSNLLIEVSNNQVLKGVIPCDLEFICDNIPVIVGFK